MGIDHENTVERLSEISDRLREPLAAKHPLLEQLLQLGMQLLLAWLTGILKPPPPPPTK